MQNLQGSFLFRLRKKTKRMIPEVFLWQSTKLTVPKLDELQKVLTDGLSKNFAEVKVEIVDCPDLRAEPFNLASSGLGGKDPTILDIGGPAYLLPLVNRDKLYDMKKIVKDLKIEPKFVIGAAAGPWPYIGKNCELAANVLVSRDNVTSRTHSTKVNDTTLQPEVQLIPDAETQFALMGNLFVSEGKPGKVIKVHCKRRTGEKDFITAMRTALLAGIPNRFVGLGGVFLLKEGKANHHVMNEFSKEPIKSEEHLNKWLSFYNLTAPIVSVGTLVSQDIPDFDLRIQHFHSFSKHNEGGHYHYDVTPETVEYLGYFNVAESLHRVDKPAESFELGKN